MNDQAMPAIGETQSPSLVELSAKTAGGRTHDAVHIHGSPGIDGALWEGFAKPEVACFMRQLNDPVVMAGPLFQPIRGVIFALAFYPLRGVLFGGRADGW